MDKQLIIYTDGVFDIPHYGHYKLFKYIKELYPNSFLIIGVSSDQDCKSYKNTTILTQNERVMTLESCKYIDKILTNIPWIITQEFIDKHSIDYICHDGNPYPCGDNKDIYKVWRDKGILITTPRTDTISTSNIIERIISRSKKMHQM